MAGGTRWRVCHPVAVRRRLLILAAVIGLAAVVVIGLSQAEESSSPQTPQRRALDPAEVRARLAGAPPPLARLHRNANGFLPGEQKGLERELGRLRGHPVVVNIWAAWCTPWPGRRCASTARGPRCRPSPGASRRGPAPSGCPSSP